jgi:hypothetical protein
MAVGHRHAAPLRLLLRREPHCISFRQRPIIPRRHIAAVEAVPQNAVNVFVAGEMVEDHLIVAFVIYQQEGTGT